MLVRPRRNRLNAQIRGLVREAHLGPQHLVYPMFVQEGEGRRTPISSMPGQARLSIDLLVELAGQAFALGVPGVALFPALDDTLKDPRGGESGNSSGSSIRFRSGSGAARGVVACIVWRLRRVSS